MIIKTVLTSIKADTQSNEADSPEVNSHLYGQPIHSKMTKIYDIEKTTTTVIHSIFRKHRRNTDPSLSNNFSIYLFWQGKQNQKINETAN